MLTFVYINVKGLIIFQAQPSWIILIAFLIIALNYFYLAFRAQNPVFAWLAPVFLLAAGEQLFELIRLGATDYIHAAHTFVYATALFAGLYLFNTWKYTRAVRTSSGFIALAAMGYAFVISQINHNPWLAVLILTGLVTSLVLVRRREFSLKLRMALNWAIPFVMGLHLFMLWAALLPPAKGDLWASRAAVASSFWHDRFVHFYLAATLLFAISLGLRRLDRELARGTFRVSHLLIPFATLLAGSAYFDYPVLLAITLLIYLVSIKVTRIDQGKNTWLRGFLFAAFSFGTLLLFSILTAVEAAERYYFYALPFASVLLAVIWWHTEANWKRWTVWYFIPLTLLGGLSLSLKPNFDAIDYGVLLITISLILFVLHRANHKNFAPLALLLLVPGTASFYDQVLQNDRIALLVTLVILMAGLRLAGQFVYANLFDFKDWKKRAWSVEIDWYAVASLVCSLAIYGDVWAMDNPGWLRLVPPMLLSALLWSHRSRVGAGVPQRIIQTLWLASLLLPYETLIHLLKLPSIIDMEARLLPLLPLAIYLSRKTWTMSRKLKESLELLVLLFITAVLFKDILVYDYFGDALITGILSLLSLYAGLHFQHKTYFYVGAGALVLNGIIQTRSFWQSLPWWAYLLLAGLILIGMASYTEMRKRKK